MPPPTPSALTRRELERRAWPYTDGQHYQHFGDPRQRGKRDALLWCQRKLEALRQRIGPDRPGWAVGQLVDELLEELAAQVPAETPGPPGVSRDLFGFGDFLALDGKPGSLLIQATTAPNASARYRKILAIPAAERWITWGNRIEVWSWRSEEVTDQEKLFRGAPKSRRVRYVLAVRALSLADFGKEG